MIFTYKLVFGLTDLKLSDFLYCAMMPEVGDTLTNFSSRLQFNYKAQLSGCTDLE